MSLLYQEVPNKRTKPQGNFSCMNSHVSMAGLAFGRSFSDPALLKHQKSGLMGRMKRIKIISSTGTESPIFLENMNPKVFLFQLISFVSLICCCCVSYFEKSEPHPAINLGSRNIHSMTKTGKRNRIVFSLKLVGPNS